MKKKNVINLVKYYAEKNDAGFRTEAYEIARDFDNTGDYQLAEYIMLFYQTRIRLFLRCLKVVLLFLKK